MEESSPVHDKKSSSSMASSSSSSKEEEERILSTLPYNRWKTDLYTEHHQMNPITLPTLFPESVIHPVFKSSKLIFPPSPTRLLDKHPTILRPARARIVKNGELTTGDTDTVPVVYNIDPNSRLTLCKRYGSDPDPVLGRLIAVNATYICYSLEEEGGIGVLSLNGGSKPLSLIPDEDYFRVTDMAFFAEDVHLLASASTDGRIFVWKINQGPDEEKKHKPQITGQIIVAVQIVGVGGESVYPRVCWHSHKQEVLVVGIGKNVLKIDTTKFGKGETLSADTKLKCHIDKLISGILFVGKHDGDVTHLSICQTETTARLVSASKDGQVKIWDDCRELAALSPYGGECVSSLTFLTSPHCPSHTILITAGPQCREIKLWSSVAESWECTQTLKFNNSAQSQVGEIFNRVIALPGAGFLLVMNAKRSVIYAVRIKYGLDPSATRMDYMTQFNVSMPILSGTNDSIRDGDHIIKVYCLQTQVFQAYELDVSQFLPSPKQTSLEQLDSPASTSNQSSGEESQKILCQLLAMQNEMRTHISDLASHDAEHHKQLKAIVRNLASHDAKHQKVVGDLASLVAKVDEVCQGMVTEYQLQIKESISPLVFPLKEAIVSLQEKTEAMSNSIAQMNCTLNQLSANAGANSEADHRKELSRLISERKYEQAFMLALESKSDSSDVLWLCPKIHLETICSERSQRDLPVGVLMLLLDRLADSMTRSDDDVLGWMKIMANAIYPTDPLVLLPVLTVLGGLLDKLKRFEASPTTEHLKDIIKAKMHHIQILAKKISPLDYKKFEDFKF